INCQNPINQVEPCNQCTSCKSFNENASFNILELDAASNNSVEHIRTLIEQVRFQPQQGTHKVFIIDEVHMLSTQAFNAFLKTLEEPPSYAIFILATTEKHKILPTILSRCQIFDFKRIQPSHIVEQLEIILKEQGRTADPEALYQIGVKADGAMRDALSIYDKIASATEGHITYKDVTSNLNILDFEYFFKVTDTFTRSDVASAMLIFDDIIKHGFEPELFIAGLSDHFRTLLLSKKPETMSILDFSNDMKQRFYNQASICTETLLLSGLNLLNQCDVFIPRATNKRLHVEVALMKLCQLGNIAEGDIFAMGEKKKNLTSPS
nr:DNA polymerase III subunit gamma/tau [Saprospiraceae bacterium]